MMSRFFCLVCFIGMTHLLIHYHYKFFSSPESMLEMNFGWNSKHGCLCSNDLFGIKSTWYAFFYFSFSSSFFFF